MDHVRRGVVGTGLRFVACSIAGGLLLGELFGGFANPDAFFVDHYANDDHQFRDLVGGHLFVASTLALLLSLLHLTRRLRALGGTEADFQAAPVSGLVGAGTAQAHSRTGRGTSRAA